MPVQRAGWTTLVLLSAFLLACHPADGPAQQTRVRDSSHELLTNNGFMLNGFMLNGFMLNGFMLNGLQIHGLGQLSIGADGIIPAGVQGVRVSGVGLKATGTATIGQAVTDAVGTGLAVFGVNGFYVHGEATGGLIVDGAGLTQVGLHGLVVNSAGQNGLRTVEWDGTQRVLADLDPARESALEAALYHLVACALPDNSSATITSSSGQANTYWGYRGLAPEWRGGALEPGNESNLRACLESSSAASMGLALNPEQEAHLDNLLRYLVSCALTDQQAATVYGGDGSTRVYSGALGLAPEWLGGAMTDANARMVSACLAARANALGETVQVSLRGPGIAVDPLERDLYDTYEGVFWADLFADTPYIKVCSVDGGGLAGRVCADGACGFDYLGDCADVCAARDPVHGHYTECDGSTEVVSTFLSLGSQVWSNDQKTQCMIDSANAAWCWGDNKKGQIGDGTIVDRDSPTPVIGIAADIAEIAMGQMHTCARTATGALWCWGTNKHGQLGITGGSVRRTAPVQVSDLGTTVARMHAGLEHTCVVRTDGTVSCFGRNKYGQLGDGTFADSSVPVQVPGLSGISALGQALSSSHVCAVTMNGDVFCWGRNDNGQLGVGDMVDRGSPVAVTIDEHGDPFTGITELCHSSGDTCARRSDGSLWCWGGNTKTRPGRYDIGQPVAPGTLSCGRRHVCVVSTDSRVWCKGYNDHGQLGFGTLGHPSNDFGAVSGVTSAAFVNAGGHYTCAALTDNSTVCWGSDPYALLPAPLSTTPSAMDWSDCGNGTCGFAEDSVSCPADCP